VTVRADDDGTIVLEGACPIDDAEPLLQHLLAHPGAAVHWRRCEHAHTAVLQVLMASGRHLVGPPGSVFLRGLVIGRPEHDNDRSACPEAWMHANASARR
jgi:hypothetical protein